MITKHPKSKWWFPTTANTPKHGCVAPNI